MEVYEPDTHSLHQKLVAGWRQ